MTVSEIQLDSPHCKRRWYQYSLRTLLVFMLVASIGLSWFVIQVRQAKRDRMLVEMLSASGYCVLYDFELEGAAPPGPRWLHALLGEHFFAAGRWTIMGPNGDAGTERVYSVNLVNSRLGEGDIECLKMLPNLMVVDLSKSRSTVTDERVNELQEALPRCWIRR